MLFAVTIFTSAFLLFEVQPLIARIILPWFGGSAAVWTACMLFFQVLVGGYLYAYGVSRLAARKQAFVHIALLIAALATLPILPGPQWKPAEAGDPTIHILVLLGAAVGVPYFLLAATSPLVQSWFTRRHPGVTPYRLFALSNFGSLLALISYPVAVEPVFAVRVQAWLWSGGFALFALLMATLALRSRSLPQEPVAATAEMQPAAAAGEVPSTAATREAQPGTASRPRRSDYIFWILLPACASVLLLSYTTHLTQNIAPIPFLWVLPLVLYLLSFILCFEHSRWYQRMIFFPLLGVCYVAVCLTLMKGNVHQPLWILISLYSATLFVACMVCHGELARIKPHPRFLTAYYVMIALGGALGGLFVSLVAPAVFTDLYELPVGMVASVVVAAQAVARSQRGAAAPTGTRKWLGGLALASGLFAGALAVALWKIYAGRAEDVIASARNFYAALHVEEEGDGEGRERLLTHGTITHGTQFLRADRRDWPTSYYGTDSGVGLAIAARRAAADGPIKIGMIGLGAGTLASYGRAGDTVRIYEINPLVRRISGRYFTYLQDARAKVEFAMGDARLSLEREPPQMFDVLAVDAFSSDAIPVHLLTQEAFTVYFRHMKPDGILAVHISNRYLDLEPVVAEAAKALGKEAREVQDEGDENQGTYSSTWILLANSAQALSGKSLAEAATPLEPSRTVRRWTDDYTELLSILK